MPWFRLDDKSWSHPKVVAAGNAAWGAFCRLGAYASDHRTDGVIPSSIAQLVATVDEIEKLVEVGLLDRNEGATAYTIHDFLEWNPSAGEVEAKRSKLTELRSKAGRVGGVRSGEVRRKLNDIEANRSKLLPSVEAPPKQTRSPYPIPTRPDPDPKEKKKKEERVAAPARPESIVWSLFRSSYERARGSKYVSDAGRDGKAAKQIVEAAKGLGADVETAVAYWCDAYFELDDAWLDSNGFPLHALVRALPKLGAPPASYRRASAEPVVADDPNAVAAARRGALDAIAAAERERTPFLFDEPKATGASNVNGAPPRDVEASGPIAVAPDVRVERSEIGTSESQQDGGATR